MSRKVPAVLAALTFGVAVLAAVLGSTTPASAVSAAAERGRIVFVDVGQGDGVVMKLGSTIVVSDIGEHNVDNVVQALDDLDAKQIDVLILSHPHDDHVANALAFLRAGWKIGLAVMSQSDWWHGTNTNRAILQELDDEHVPVKIVARGDPVDWGGAQWRILNPPKDDFVGGSNQAANASIAYLLTFNGVTALFTGDVEAKVGRRIAAELDPIVDEPVDIFLATHHGSKEGSVQELLDVIQPRWVVISTGPNGFHHPRPEAIARLEATGATIWCTEVNGSVTARISAAGRLTWRASVQQAPWWSGRDHRQNGTCVGQ